MMGNISQELDNVKQFHVVYKSLALGEHYYREKRFTNMRTKIFLIATVMLFMAHNLPLVTPVTPMPTPAPKPSPAPSDLPGLVVRGRVTLDGVGLTNVKIYKRFSAYPHDLIAVTDENGYYESNFIPIPGDEMVSVEAELAGYTFTPPYYYWRHYHGYEITTYDFVATASP